MKQNSRFGWEEGDLLFSDDAFEKASFGGDRSEAGRYAANIRWQGNVKGEGKPSVNLSADQLKAIAKINEATKYVTSKGFSVEKFNGADGKKSKELANAYYKQEDLTLKKRNEESLETLRNRPKRKDYDSFEAWQKASAKFDEKDLPSARARQGRFVIREILERTNYNSEQLSSEVAPRYSDIYVLRDSKGVIAAVGNATTTTLSNGETTMQIDYIGSAQVLKGAGSALWGAMIKSHSLQNGYSIGFDVADDAFSFWSTMGLKMQTYGARISSASLLDVKNFAEELK